MPSQKSRIYLLLTGLTILGYVWVGLALGRETGESVIVCPIKTVSGIPCPACGSTRSVIQLVQGDFWGAIQSNPFGLLIFITLIFTPLWLIYDITTKKESLWQFYQNVESFVRRKKIAVFLILLVLANWLWNISKGI